MDEHRLGGLSQDTEVRDHGTSENNRGLNEGDTETSLCDECAVVRLDDKKWGCGVGKHDGERGLPYVIFPGFFYEEIELAYEREDTYPDLPALEQGSMNGCEFCKLLRKSLRKRSDLPHGIVGRNGEGQGVARILTRKISYEWRTMKFLDLFRGSGPSYRRAHLRLDYNWINGTGSSAPESLYFDVFSDQRQLASWLRIHRDFPPTSYLHPQVLSQITGWLDSTSQRVNFSNENPSVPTRLVDVGSSDGTQQPRLVVPREDLHTSLYGAVSYVALSYCWGEPGDLQLKTTNCVLESFRREIPLESCPDTFRDAIKFVRTIGLRYLWIDALCIIQDDRLDWERESVKMYEIYSRAHLTLVPLKCESPKMGFLERGQRPRMKLHFNSALEDGINGSFWLQPASSGLWDWQGSPTLPLHDHEMSRWVKRAWTLQEREFSPRLLYFGNNVVRLETYDGKDLSDNGHNSSNTPAEVAELFYREPSIKSCLEARVDRIGAAWTVLIASYSNRDLTFPHDRFPAISSLVSLIQNHTKDTYLAGLWLSHLHVHLLWQIDKESKVAIAEIAELVHQLCNPDPYFAPSWSWARTKQKVHFLISTQLEPESEVLDALTVPEGLNTFGAVSYGHLVLRGRMYHLKSYSVIQDGRKQTISVGGELIADVHIDVALGDEEELHVNNFEDPFGGHLSTSPLSNMVMFLIASSYERHFLDGLLLIPKENGPDWLRIGTFHSPALSTLKTPFFDSYETVVVKIL